MAVTTGKVISLLEREALPGLQAEWDNSGLQVGDRQWPVEKILLALDITVEVVQYAIHHGYNFIFSHHPLLFHSQKRIDAATPTGRIIALALTNKISIYSMHTNLDVVKGGVSDALAELLNLTDVKILDRQKGDYYKLAVFGPNSHLVPLRQALGEAGAGWIGNYSHCVFSAPGQGTFLPRAGAEPWLGDVGTLTEVEEFKVETLVPSHQLTQVLAAMTSVHPYEEIAYDLVPLANPANHGLGRIGLLPQAMTLDTFAARVASVLDCPLPKLSGEGKGKVRKIAVCGGSGGSFVDLAHRRKADVLVTGDIDHHQALTASQLGLALVDPGHYFSEIPILARIEAALGSSLQEIEISRYPSSTNPLRNLDHS